MRKPVGSKDVSNVPPPNPENYTAFQKGFIFNFGSGLMFRVDEIFDTWIKCTEFLHDEQVHGEMDIDHPIVIVKDLSGLPLITLTLREIAGDTVMIQATAREDVRTVPRGDIQ